MYLISLFWLSQNHEHLPVSQAAVIIPMDYSQAGVRMDAEHSTQAASADAFGTKAFGEGLLL